MIVFEPRTEVSVSSDFIETVCSVVPSTLEAANLSVAAQNFVVDSVNDTNRRTNSVQFVVSDETSHGDSLYRRALLTLYWSLDDPAIFLDEATSSWEIGMHRVKENSATVRSLPTIGPALEVRERLSAQVPLIAKQTNAIDNIHREFETAYPDSIDRVIGAFAHPVEAKSDEELVLHSLIGALSYRSKNTGLVHSDSIVSAVLSGQHDGPLFMRGISDDLLESRTRSIRNVAGYTIAVLKGLSPAIEEAELVSALAGGINEIRGNGLREIEYLRGLVATQFTEVQAFLAKSGSVPMRSKDVGEIKKYLELAFETRIYELIKNAVLKSEVSAISKRKNRIKQEIGQFEETGKFEVKEEIVREVGVLSGTSDCTLKFEPTDLDRLVKGYSSKYKQEPGLTEELNAVIEFFKTIDFSSGDVKGVKPMGYNIIVNAAPAKLFQAKPSDIIGVKGGRQFSVTRILFSVNSDGSIGLLNICDRQDANRVVRNYGFGSKRRG